MSILDLRFYQLNLICSYVWFQSSATPVQSCVLFWTPGIRTDLFEYVVNFVTNEGKRSKMNGENKQISLTGAMNYQIDCHDLNDSCFDSFDTHFVSTILQEYI